MCLTRTIAAFIIAVLFSVNGIAQEDTRVLTWEDCIKEAYNNHPELISAREKVKQSRYNKEGVFSAMQPSVEAVSTAKRSVSQGKAPGNDFSYGLTGSQLLFDGFKVSNNERSAYELMLASMYDYSVVSSNIRLRLRNAYIELLRADADLVLSLDIVERRKKNTELVRMRYNAGREHKGALLTAEANQAQAEFDLTQAKRGIDLARSKLSREMGRDGYGFVTVSGSLAEVKVQPGIPDFIRIAETNPLLKELIAKKDSARFNAAAKKSAFFPDIYASGAISRSGGEFMKGKENWSLGLTMTLPVFEGGKRVYDLRQALAQMKQAASDMKNGRDEVTYTLHEMWTQLVNAVDRVVVRKKFLEATEERARIAEAQYSNGLVSFDNWTIIEDDLVNDKKTYLNSQAEAMAAAAYWEQARGETLDDIYQ